VEEREAGINFIEGTGHQQNTDSRTILQEPCAQLNSTHFGHTHVRQEQVNITGKTAGQNKCFFAIFRRQHKVVGVTDDTAEQRTSGGKLLAACMPVALGGEPSYGSAPWPQRFNEYVAARSDLSQIILRRAIDYFIEQCI